MAIQVNGTTVINNSRSLTNIASIDATTATAIGNAGVGGISSTVTTSANAFSYTGSNVFGQSDNGIISNSTPPSGIVYASKTISSGVGLASVATVANSSGITIYQQGYYGVTVGILHWDNSASTLNMLGRGFPTSVLSSSASSAYQWILGRSASSGIIAVSPNDVLYAVVISAYDNPGVTGGASWSAGTVNTTFLEVS